MVMPAVDQMRVQMDMPRAVMNVLMRVHGPRGDHRPKSQCDQDQANPAFHPPACRLGNLQTKENQEKSSYENRSSVPECPKKTKAHGLARCRFLNCKGCYGREMICLKGVQRAEDYRRQEWELEGHAQ